MRRTRCYVDIVLEAGATVELPDATAHHLSRVLRMQPGDGVTLFNGNGGEWDATLCGSRKRPDALVEQHHDRNPECALPITLVQALAKGDRTDTAVQKSTELGAVRIVLLRTARSDVKLAADRQDKRARHWQQVAVSAAEQSGRTRVPEVVLADDWQAAALPPGARGVFACPQSPSRGLSGQSQPAALWIAVGPEGGFDARDRDALLHLGWRGIGLGPRVLRTETAGPAIMAAALERWSLW